MTHFSNGIDQTNLYTTERIPTFTFVVDGPDAKNKKVTESQTRLENAKCILPEKQCQHQQQQQQPQQKKHDDDMTTRTVPPGALHIVPSWQPLDANEKPPYSYATLIGHAILSSDHRRLTLSDIYQWITQHYPFYSMTEHGWQNSIRHNLSLNKAFVRIQRPSKTSSGKGSFWTILAGKEYIFIDNLIKRREPIRKQPANLPRILQHRRSSHRLDSVAATNDHDSSLHTNTSHLFTTFRMTPTTPSPSLSTPTSVTICDRSTHRKRSMPELNQRQNPISTKIKIDDGYESDCDSGVDFGHNKNSRSTQLKKAKSTPCLYEDHLYNNDAVMMDYTFETLLSTSSLSSSSSTYDNIAATDELSNWTDSINRVTPPLLEWNPLFPTDAALNLTPGSPCMDMSYQHLLSSVPTLPMLQSVASIGHHLLSSSSPTTTSTNGLIYYDPLFESNWSL